jgi:hypothetical protein
VTPAQALPFVHPITTTMMSVGRLFDFKITSSFDVKKKNLEIDDFPMLVF